MDQLKRLLLPDATLFVFVAETCSQPTSHERIFEYGSLHRTLLLIEILRVTPNMMVFCQLDNLHRCVYPSIQKALNELPITLYKLYDRRSSILLPRNIWPPIYGKHRILGAYSQ